MLAEVLPIRTWKLKRKVVTFVECDGTMGRHNALRKLGSGSSDGGRKLS